MLSLLWHKLPEYSRWRFVLNFFLRLDIIIFSTKVVSKAQFSSPSISMAPRKTVHPLRFKLITLGDIGVGKTSIIRQLCENRFFDSYHETVGVDYGMKRLLIGDRDVRLHFFDLSGNPEFLNVRNEFYRDIHGVVFVYDLQNPQSFQHLEDWMQEITAVFPHPIYQSLVMAVCANKIDLCESNTTEGGKLWAQHHGFEHYEISARNNHGIQEAFQAISRSMIIAFNS